jgi:hypothetical protein
MFWWSYGMPVCCMREKENTEATARLRCCMQQEEYPCVSTCRVIHTLHPRNCICQHFKLLPLRNTSNSIPARQPISSLHFSLPATGQVGFRKAHQAIAIASPFASSSIFRSSNLCFMCLSDVPVALGLPVYQVARLSH